MVPRACRQPKAARRRTRNVAASSPEGRAVNKAKKPDLLDDGNHKAVKAANPAARTKRKGQDFGLEGTNKTVPVPQADAQPADQLQGTKSKFIPKTPYTRG